MVRRSAMRMWFMALACIPLLVIAIDVLTSRRIANWLREIIFRPEDTQIYEPRDRIWAWVILLVAGVVVIWGLKELFSPTRVLETRDEGLLLKLAGPFRPATLVPWDLVVDVDGIEIDDDGEKIPLFWLELTTRDVIPAHPWGARWLEGNQLGILAQDWSEPPQVVAEKVADFAVEAARRQPPTVRARGGSETEEE